MLDKQKLGEAPTTEAMTAWLRKQPPDGEYTWQDPVFCLMGRYLADQGSLWGEFSYSDMGDYYAIAAEKPWTYGAALARAEKLKALPAPVERPIGEAPRLTVDQDDVSIPANPVVEAVGFEPRALIGG